jgi:hypothetical protein
MLGNGKKVRWIGSWAVGQNPSPVDANHAYTQPQLGFYNSSSSGIYPNAHHGSTPNGPGGVCSGLLGVGCSGGGGGGGVVGVVSVSMG